MTLSSTMDTTTTIITQTITTNVSTTTDTVTSTTTDTVTPTTTDTVTPTTTTINPSPTIFVPPSPSLAPKITTAIGGPNGEYTVQCGPNNYDDAKISCEASGSELVSIDTLLTNVDVNIVCLQFQG